MCIQGKDINYSCTSLYSKHKINCIKYILCRYISISLQKYYIKVLCYKIQVRKLE